MLRTPDQANAPNSRTVLMRHITRHIARHGVALLSSALASSVSFAQTPPPVQPRQPARAPQAGPAPTRQSGPAGARRAAPPQAGPRSEFGPGGGTAGMLLGMRQQLDLTDDQVKRLEALRAAPRRQRNEADQLRARADMMDAMQGDGDLAKARAVMDRMSRMRNDEAIARLQERQDVRNVLTATQKTTIDNMRGTMRGRMKQGMREGARQRLRQGRDMRMRGPEQNRLQNSMQDRMQNSMQDRMQHRMPRRPGAPGEMGPPMGRRGREIEQDVVMERRPPVPPTDSLIPR